MKGDCCISGRVDNILAISSWEGFPNFEMLDAKIASALNRIIHNSHYKRKVSWRNKKVQKEDRFFRGKHHVYLIFEYFQVFGANESVDNYADPFTIVLRNDDTIGAKRKLS